MLFLSVSDTFEKKSDSPGLFCIVFIPALPVNHYLIKAGRFFGRALKVGGGGRLLCIIGQNLIIQCSLCYRHDSADHFLNE